MVNEEECKIIECFATKNGQKIMIEVEYDVNGETRKRGWGFSLDAFDSGRFINLIDLKIKEERAMPDTPSSIKQKILRFKGHKIDLTNKKIIDKDTGKEIL